MQNNIAYSETSNININKWNQYFNKRLIQKIALRLYKEYMFKNFKIVVK